MANRINEIRAWYESQTSEMEVYEAIGSGTAEDLRMIGTLLERLGQAERLLAQHSDHGHQCCKYLDDLCGETIVFLAGETA